MKIMKIKVQDNNMNLGRGDIFVEINDVHATEITYLLHVYEKKHAFFLREGDHTGSPLQLNDDSLAERSRSHRVAKHPMSSRHRMFVQNPSTSK